MKTQSFNNFWMGFIILFAIGIICLFILISGKETLPNQKELCYNFTKEKLIIVNQAINANNKTIWLPEIYCVINTEKCLCTLTYTFDFNEINK